jgi:hypothetical protein
MILVRLFLITVTVLLPLAPPASRPGSAYDEIDQTFGHIDRNFTVIDSELVKRGPRLSAVFLENINGIRDIVQQRKEQKAQFSNQNNTNLSLPDRERYTEELKAIDVDTTGVASFLQAAPPSEDGETKVRFDTQFNYHPNDGWWVCWISYGRSKSQKPTCSLQFSTPFPKPTENPQPLAAGCKYVVTVVDPKAPTTSHNPFPSGFVEIPSADREYPIAVPVPYEIKAQQEAEAPKNIDVKKKRTGKRRHTE